MASSLPNPRVIVATNLPFGSDVSDSVTEPPVKVLDESLELVSMFGGALRRAGIATVPTVPAKDEEV
jgi:hypothetical protein